MTCASFSSRSHEFALSPDQSVSFTTEETKRIQAVTGALLCHARAVDNKMLVALVTIVIQDHSPVELNSICNIKIMIVLN